MNKFIKNCLLTVGFGYVLSYGGGDLGVYDVIVPISKNCASGCGNSAYLMWEDMPFSDDCDEAYKNNRSACKAGDFSYAKNFCSNLNYAGYTDWRLPTSDELMEASKQKNIFKNNRGADFWTSTPGMNGKYYVVYTVDGFRYERPASQSNYIRCVRCVPKENIKK